MAHEVSRLFRVCVSHAEEESLAGSAAYTHKAVAVSIAHDSLRIVVEHAWEPATAIRALALADTLY